MSANVHFGVLDAMRSLPAFDYAILAKAKIRLSGEYHF